MMNETLTNTTNPVNQKKPRKCFVSLIPINFLTIGTIIRASEIEDLITRDGYASAPLSDEKAVARRFYFADCLSRFQYKGLYKTGSVRSFAVCPTCSRGFEF